MEPIPGAWFWRQKPVALPRARLFCFPYAGANAMVFRTWVAHLPPDVELVAAQLPGRGPRIREAPMTTLKPLVEALGQALAPSRIPFVMFGHSMGGLVAFALCHWLRARGLRAPMHLFISGRRAAQFPDSYPPTGELTDAYILSCIRRYGGTPASVLAEPGLMDLILPAFRADFELLRSYRHVPTEPLDVPLTALGGAKDDTVQPAQLEGWRESTNGPFALRIFEGDHFFLHSAEAAVLRVVKQAFAGIA
ncbi:thioesterase II family protein [Polyangium fumosum]|uniref:Thioesterase n=1 Tax=Polyangium fumosum TaxID=889272 RepID=A0A4U1IQH2_9BACT|nr:alpha/beta fold hydrolase [Polyangium fumosum]TKC96374.1 thioesterase [Polyangium fumosum]